MTSRERWRAAVRSQPVDGLPFWPKVGAAYLAVQGEEFRGMTPRELHRWIGSDPQESLGAGLREVSDTAKREVKDEVGGQRTVFRTRRGRVELVTRVDPASQSDHPVEFPVKSREDILLLTEFFAEVSYEWDEAALEGARRRAAEVGEEAVTAVSIGTSALMDWVQYFAGVEQAHYLLADYPEEVEELFEAIHRGLRRRAEMLAERHPADLLYMTENTSTMLVSPAQYRKYCYPHLEEYARIAQAAGRALILHMCGHLRDLLPDLERLPVAGLEAFTSPPVGNTRLAEGRAACPDKCLIGGTNATLWLRPTEEILAELEEDLGALEHHRGLVMSSAGVMPPACAPETIRAVCAWVQAYPARSS